MSFDFRNWSLMGGAPDVVHRRLPRLFPPLPEQESEPDAPLVNSMESWREALTVMMKRQRAKNAEASRRVDGILQDDAARGARAELEKAAIRSAMVDGQYVGGADGVLLNGIPIESFSNHALRKIGRRCPIDMAREPVPFSIVEESNGSSPRPDQLAVRLDPQPGAKLAYKDKPIGTKRTLSLEGYEATGVARGVLRAELYWPHTLSGKIPNDIVVKFVGTLRCAVFDEAIQLAIPTGHAVREFVAHPDDIAEFVATLSDRKD